MKVLRHRRGGPRSRPIRRHRWLASSSARRRCDARNRPKPETGHERVGALRRAGRMTPAAAEAGVTPAELRRCRSARPEGARIGASDDRAQRCAPTGPEAAMQGHDAGAPADANAQPQRRRPCRKPPPRYRSDVRGRAIPGRSSDAETRRRPGLAKASMRIDPARTRPAARPASQPTHRREDAGTSPDGRGRGLRCWPPLTASENALSMVARPESGRMRAAETRGPRSTRGPDYLRKSGRVSCRRTWGSS